MSLLLISCFFFELFMCFILLHLILFSSFVLLGVVSGGIGEREGTRRGGGGGSKLTNTEIVNIK